MKKIGYIGLGKMGGNMVERLVEKGHHVTAFDPSIDARTATEAKGAQVRSSMAQVVEALETPRLIWLMVPHATVDSVLAELLPLLTEGDTVIDGGNSNYKESMRRAKETESKGVSYLDAGVSGGPSGARNGACIMVGGEKKTFDAFESLFADLSVPEGYIYAGKAGSGHFVKMVHNGIEYGMMQAIAEGFAVMKKSNFDLDLNRVAHVYNHGSVIESKLTAWLENAYKEEGIELEAITGEPSASGEGKWTVETAKELGVPVPIIEGSLRFREESQGNPSYTGQVVSALRNQFGGHSVKKH